MRSFDSVWEEIQDKSRVAMRMNAPIYTLDKNTANKIIDVTEEYIRRDSEGKKTGGADKIRKQDMRIVWEKLVRSGKIRPTEYNILYFTYALLARFIDQIDYKKRPLILTINKAQDNETKYVPVSQKFKRIAKGRENSHTPVRGGEGPIHKKLKTLVAQDPLGTLGEKLTLVDEGIEYPFVTGDRLDLLFLDEDKRYVCVEIEVDVSDNDIIGFHQAGKYRTLVAMAEELPINMVRAIVAARSISPSLIDYFAERYVIESKVIKRANHSDG